MTAKPDLAELVPQTDSERYEAGRAVYNERRAHEDEALIDALTERERMLIGLAWEEGIRIAKTELAKRLASPHAATLDAVSVRKAVDDWRDSSVEALLFPPPPGFPRRSDQAAKIIRTADRMLADREGTI